MAGGPARGRLRRPADGRVDQSSADHGPAAHRRKRPPRGAPPDPAVARQGRHLAASAQHEPGGTRFHIAAKGGSGPGFVGVNHLKRVRPKTCALAKYGEEHRMEVNSEYRSSIGKPSAFHSWGI